MTITAATFVWSSRLPDVYTSETLIMVDPQKVPDSYVKSTVAGDVRNRLGTLSQQILSATRLQKIIDTVGLYPQERAAMAREDVISLMRRDISVQVVSNFGASDDLQAFRIQYSGKQPRVVAQVANELASLFIEENLKAREQQATGTTEFLQNQLQETRKALEAQEAQLKDFKLKHIGEMPEHQSASIQILNQLQSQLQIESEALNRAEQQRGYVQSMLSGQTSAPVVDMDSFERSGPRVPQGAAKVHSSSALKTKLSDLLNRYSEDHPDVRKLKKQIEAEERNKPKEVAAAPPIASSPTETLPQRPSGPPSGAVRYVNPVLDSQLKAVEAEIEKRKQEQQRLAKMIAKYQARLEAIPVREQEITELVRDYEISKAHYKQLLEKQMSAETATQLEIRQKGERFSVLDPAQPAERPSRPNRTLLNAGGSLVGLGLGLLLALITEFLGMSVTAPEQIVAATGLPVLEVIPVIHTHADRVVRKRRTVLAVLSASGAMLCGFVAVLYHYRDRLF